MNDLIFAKEINAILEDDTEVSGVIGLIYNNERILSLIHISEPTRPY